METKTQVWLTHTSEKIPFKVAKDENGNLRYFPGVAPFTSPQIYSGGFSLESINANVDVPIAFDSWSVGAGFHEADLQDVGAASSYNYSQGVDASWPRRLYLSPQLQTGGSVASAPIKFLESTHGLFCMTTRYVYQWSGTQWLARLDVGASNTLNDIFEYTNDDATYIMAGVEDDAYYYSTNGSAFSQIENFSNGPSFRSSSSQGFVSSSSISASKPSATTTNDIVIAQVYVDTTTTISATDNGGGTWTLLEQLAGSGSQTYAIFWKRAESDEPTSYGFSFASGGRCYLQLTTWKDCVSTGEPIEGFEMKTDSATAHDTDATTVSGDNRRGVVLLGFGNDDAGATTPGTITPPSGWAVAASATFLQAFDKDDLSNSGAFSSISFTSGTSIPSTVAILFLKPAEGTPRAARWAVRGSASGAPLLWAITSEGDIRNSGDPTTVSSWSASDTIQLGEGVTISGLEVMDNTFYLVNSKGITSYDGTEVSTVWEAKGLTLESDAARPYVWADRRLYFTFSGTLFRYEKDTNVIERIWPRGPQVGNDELNGTITAITGDSGSLYFTLKNSDGNYYIMKGDPTRSVTIAGEDIYPFHSWVYRSTGVVGAALVVPKGTPSGTSESTLSWTGGTVGAAASIDLSVPSTVIEVTNGTTQAAAVLAALAAGDCRIWTETDITVNLGSSQIELGQGPIQVFSESGTFTLNGASIDNAAMFLQETSDVFFGNVDFIMSAGQDDSVSGGNNPAGVIEFTTSGADNLYMLHCQFTSPDVTAEFGSPNDGPEGINVWNNGPGTGDSPNNITIHGHNVTRGVGDTKSVIAGGSSDAVNFWITAYRSVFDTHQRSPRVGDGASADWVNCVWVNNGDRIYGAAAADDGIFIARGNAIGKTSDSTPGRQEIDDDGTGNTIYAPTSGAGNNNNLLVTGTQGVPSIETTTSTLPSLPYTLDPAVMDSTLMATIISEAGPGNIVITHQSGGGVSHFSTTNPQMVVGNSSNGDYFVLPRLGLRPEDDSNYLFDTTAANIYGPWVDGGAKTYFKFLNAGRFIGESLTADRTVALKYQVDGGSSSTIGTYTSDGLQVTSISSDVEFARLRSHLTLDTNVNTAAPRVIAYSYSTSLNPSRKRTWVLDIELDDEVEDPMGGEGRYSWFKLEDFLFDALQERVTFTDRHNRTYTCKLDDVKGVTIGGDKEVYQVTLTEL